MKLPKQQQRYHHWVPILRTQWWHLLHDARVLYESSLFSKDVAADVLPRNGLDCESSGCQTKGLLSMVSRVVAAKQAAILHAQLDSEGRKVALLAASGD